MIYCKILLSNILIDLKYSRTNHHYGLSANLKHQLSLVDCIIIQIVQLRFEFQVLQMLRHSD